MSQNLENGEEKEKWKYKSPARERKNMSHFSSRFSRDQDSCQWLLDNLVDHEHNHEEPNFYFHCLVADCLDDYEKIDNDFSDEPCYYKLL